MRRSQSLSCWPSRFRLTCAVCSDCRAFCVFSVTDCSCCSTDLSPSRSRRCCTRFSSFSWLASSWRLMLSASRAPSVAICFCWAACNLAWAASISSSVLLRVAFCSMIESRRDATVALSLSCSVCMPSSRHWLSICLRNSDCLCWSASICCCSCSFLVCHVTSFLPAVETV